MTNPYSYWKSALAGEKPSMYVDDPQCGFFRKGVYTKEPNKAAKRTGWMPVAIFMNGAELTAVIGRSAENDRDKINELWSYCAANPISEETYRAVAERGENWPDSHETVASISVANSSSAVVVTGDVLPDAVISAKIDEAAAHLVKFSTIDSDEQSSKARSLQQKFLDLRGEAKKHYDALNDPLLAEQKRIRGIWFPLRDRADEAAGKLRDAMGRWEDEKRKAAKLAQEAADKAAREHADAVRKAAEANEPAPLAPESVKTNIPAPSTQIRGGSGRAANVRVEMVVTAIDVAKVFEQFKDDPRVIEFLTDLAQKAVRAGIAVPGATTEERSVVR